jgi:uncharacterized protein
MSQNPLNYQTALRDYIQAQALPPDKFSHQDRLYKLAVELAADQAFDDDVVYAAAWLHDLGVFIGHRPEDPQLLPQWNHVEYAVAQTPGILRRFGFPESKIPAVLDAIRTHMPKDDPTSFEAVLLRDADILEQLGAVAILRTVSKVGRDTRFIRFSDALRVLHQNAENLPGVLRLQTARNRAVARVEFLRSFLAATEAEGNGLDW